MVHTRTLILTNLTWGQNLPAAEFESEVENVRQGSAVQSKSGISVSQVGPGWHGVR